MVCLGGQLYVWGFYWWGLWGSEWTKNQKPKYHNLKINQRKNSQFHKFPQITPGNWDHQAENLTDRRMTASVWKVQTAERSCSLEDNSSDSSSKSIHCRATRAHWLEFLWEPLDLVLQSEAQSEITFSTLLGSTWTTGLCNERNLPS